MRISILVYDSTLLSPHEKRVVKRGWVYIDGERVKALGEGEPPVEYEAANLVIGGEGRVVVPAFASAHTHLVLHPLRALVEPDAAATDLARFIAESLSEREAYLLALTALYELTLNGIVAVEATDPHGEAVARAMLDAGVRGVVAIPMPGCRYSRSDWREVYESLSERYSGRIGITLAACTESDYEEARRMGVSPRLNPPIAWSIENAQRVHVESNGVYVPCRGCKPGENIALGLDALHATNPLHASFAAYAQGLDEVSAIRGVMVKAFESLGFEAPGFREGAPGSLVVYDMSMPPGFRAYTVEGLCSILIRSEPRVETVVAWGQPLVDQGEHMLIDRGKVVEGLRIAEKLVEELTGRLR